MGESVLHYFRFPLEPAPRTSDLIHDRRSVRAVLGVLAVLAVIAVTRILSLLYRYSNYSGLLRVFATALFISTILTGITVVILRWLDLRDPLPRQVYAGLLVLGRRAQHRPGFAGKPAHFARGRPLGGTKELDSLRG